MALVGAVSSLLDSVARTVPAQIPPCSACVQNRSRNTRSLLLSKETQAFLILSIRLTLFALPSSAVALLLVLFRGVCFGFYRTVFSTPGRLGFCTFSLLHLLCIPCTYAPTFRPFWNPIYDLSGRISRVHFQSIGPSTLGPCRSTGLITNFMHDVEGISKSPHLHM